MASSASLEASEIRRRGRRRLLGAVTLVLLVVVFVPMILDSDPRPQRKEPSLVIPPKDSAPPLPTPAPAASSSRAPQSGDGPGPQAAAAKPEPPAAKVDVAPAPPAKAEASPAKPAPAKTAAAPKLEGFAVQVGAFRDDSRLKQARQKLEAAGVVHYTERVDTKGGTVTRLRAGPFKTREAADKARETLKRASLEGKIVPLP